MMRTFLLITLSLLFFLPSELKSAGDDGPAVDSSALVYVFDINEEIAPPVNRRMKKAFAEARSLHASLIVLHMNTYGGQVVDADSMRTRVLHSPIPVVVFVDNNAASAGALISIACEKIYMHPGATLGAATVVGSDARAMPDKYQSYMRAQMRATAEVRGRRPEIAEAMVDQDLYVPGVSDSGKVLTLTTSEARILGYCDGVATNLDEAIKLYGLEHYTMVKPQFTATDKIIDFLINPFVHGLLIMLIVGGLYFELQSPGVGFPGIAALLGAFLLFTPLFIEGLAQNWEILIFVTGLLLMIVEIFVIPGFGVTGILGLIFIVSGLTLSLLANVDMDFSAIPLETIGRAFLLVVVSIFLGVLLAYQGVKLAFGEHRFSLALHSSEASVEGYVSHSFDMDDLTGRYGKAYTMLRPSGKVEIGKELYDAITHQAFIEQGERVKVVGFSNAQLVVEKASLAEA